MHVDNAAQIPFNSFVNFTHNKGLTHGFGMQSMAA